MQKRKTYRNKKILDAAKGEPCLVNLPRCTGGGADTVAAHSNSADDGKGMGQKADDSMIAFACASCHDILDRRKPLIMLTENGSFLGGASELQWYHDRGIKRTIRRLLDMGVLK